MNNVFKGTQGQTIIIDIDTDENSRLIMANIYAPSGGTRQKERKSFFSKLEDTLRDLNSENIILGGDFNCVLNNELDRSHAVTYRDQSHTRRSRKNRSIRANGADEVSGTDSKVMNPEQQSYSERTSVLV